MKNKIILSFAVIIFATMIFNIQSVLGVGIVSHSWIYDVNQDGKNDLVFRTYTNPDESLVRDYQNTKSSDYIIEGSKEYTYKDTNGKTQKSKWVEVYKDGVDTLPSNATFVSIGVKFHTAPLTSYSGLSDSVSGMQFGYNEAKIELTDKISTVATAINDSKGKYVRNVPEKASSIFHEMLAFKGNFSNVNWGTGLRVTGLRLDKSLEYRYAIVEINGLNVYIGDTVIYNDELMELIQKAKTAGSTDSCYVSNIVVSKTYHETGGYEAAYTAYDFFHQIGKYTENSDGTITTAWSNRTRGLSSSDKALGSVLNLFDNKIIFPQLSNKTVLVKHINLGNTTVISRDTLRSGTLLKSNNISLIAYDYTNEKNVIGSEISSYNTGYQEYYEGMLDIGQGIRKNALADNDEYTCIGYNVGISNSRDSAQKLVNDKVASMKYTPGNEVDIKPSTSASSEEVVVIEFYYSNAGKNVYANHVYVGDDGKVLEMSQQTIIPNQIAGAGETTVYRINDDEYVSEIYIQPVGKEIQVSIVYDVKNYLGCQVSTEQQSVQDIVGTTVNVNGLNKSTMVNLSADNNVQVNFYYKINARKQRAPKLGGNLFVDAVITNVEKDISTTCTDEEENNNIVETIPSGSKVKLGINDISHYMMAAATEKYVLNNKKIDISFTFKRGTVQKKITYPTIEYKLGYYYLTNMAVYSLNNITVYDAGSSETIGSSMFNWENGKINITPSKVQIPLVLTGLKGEIESKNSATINDMSNYANIEFSYTYKDFNGEDITVTQDISQKTSLDNEIVLLTEEQIDEVDANGDGTIDYKDQQHIKAEINYITPLLNKAISTWNELKETECKDMTYTQPNCLYWESAYNKATNNLQKLDAFYKIMKDIVDDPNIKIYGFYVDGTTNRVDFRYNDSTKHIEYIGNFISKYESYRQKEVLFMNLFNVSKEIIADDYKMNIAIGVKNMDVKLNNTSLLNYNGNGPSASSNLDLANGVSAITVMTEKPTINKQIYNGITGMNITKSMYSKEHQIATSVLNGLRALKGEVTYNTEVLIGEETATNISDNVYYSEEQATFNMDKTILTQYYKVDLDANNVSEKYEKVEPINIYTPITVSANLETETGYLKLNSPFTINMTNTAKEINYNVTNTSKFSAGYFVKFGFDVTNVSINGKIYKSGEKVAAGTWIGLIKGEEASITATVYNQTNDMTYTVRAVAVNATQLMLDQSTRYDALEDMINGAIGDSVYNICNEVSYFAEISSDQFIVENRIYDFKVTDLKDLSWKNIFRKNTSTATNAHTGIVYYSGTRKWIANSESSNGLVSRSASEIGNNPLRILPIGPYKNTNTNYTAAPKLGYRFSYDLKVTGSYYNNNNEANTNKVVNISTSFYYISKDGKTYLQEYTGSGTGIYLFYKNSSGKYVRIDQNGGGYELTFTPNDGYRYIEDSDLSTLSSKSVKLGNLRNITLTNQMATSLDNGLGITYYGEYKLPNSTIAVRVENGKYDINKPLSDGYIGVVFDIKAKNLEEKTEVSYSKNMPGKTNTSQWDYEGFLGYTKEGEAVKDNSLYLKLEKGNWNISQDIYNKIKGSVILYDIDQRAATDYE